jgi:hypothetical protein
MRPAKWACPGAGSEREFVGEGIDELVPASPHLLILSIGFKGGVVLAVSLAGFAGRQFIFLQHLLPLRGVVW